MSYDSAITAELIKINNRYEEHWVEKITNPVAITNHSDYMYAAGVIYALRTIVPDILEEAIDVLAKR